MNKSQYFTIGGFVLLFAVLYFGFDTKPKEIKIAEKSRVNFIETTNIQNLLQEARENMRPDEMGVMDAMYMRVEAAETDSMKIQEFKNLSSSWYRQSYYGIAGYYAEEIAKILESEESWSIAGTTYAAGISKANSEKERKFCAERSREVLEKAVSINPDNVNHKINLAVTFAEMPVADNPMKGVMMLLDLNEKNPENVSVLYQLARFGLKTGQHDKATERLIKALSIEPNNQRLICLLADVYSASGNKSKSEEFRSRCKI